MGGRARCGTVLHRGDASAPQILEHLSDAYQTEGAQTFYFFEVTAERTWREDQCDAGLGTGAPGEHCGVQVNQFACPFPVRSNLCRPIMKTRDLSKLLVAFENVGAPLSVSGGIQLSPPSGVCSTMFRPRSLHGILLAVDCDMTLRADSRLLEEGKLEETERRTFAGPSVGNAELRITVSFDSQVPETCSDSAVELIRVRRLGTIEEVLTDEGIAKTANAAAIATWDQWCIALGDQEHPLADIAYHVEKNSPIEVVEEQMLLSTEDAERWIADYQEVRNRLLAPMIAHAKARVSAQLTLLRGD